MYRLHGFYTQNTLKTLYVLEELGVEFEFRFVDLAKGENRSQEFRALNPAGRVPVLEHDGQFLFESGAWSTRRCFRRTSSNAHVWISG